MSKGKKKSFDLGNADAVKAETVQADGAIEKTIATIRTIQQVCIGCKAKYEVTETTFKDGSKDLNPKHGRCPRCQTVHLMNLRVAKFETAARHIGNMAARLQSQEEREAVCKYCETVFAEQVLSRLLGVKSAITRFDLNSL